MWLNYFTIAVRNLAKHKLIACINILGFALGMSCFFLILRYVSFEMSFDQFHPHKQDIYRVSYHAHFANDAEIAAIPSPIGPLMTDYFPEIVATARIYKRGVSIKMRESQQSFEVPEAFFADSTLLKVFHFDWIYGDAATALHQPGAVIVSEEVALKLFGRRDVLGRRIQVGNQPNFQVTGVVKDWPEESHIDFQLVCQYEDMFLLEPKETRKKVADVVGRNWVASHSYTYVRLKAGENVEAVNERFKDFIRTFGNEEIRDQQEFTLMPITDIHLYSEEGMELKPPTNIQYLYLFLSIGIITLLIACMNFINLSTASSFGRAREVGVRKVLGADQQSVISQFLGESVMLSIVAFILACISAILFLPSINELANIQLSLNPIQYPVSWLIFGFVSILVGLLAGSYPAFIVSKFHPATIFKSSMGLSLQPGGIRLRNVLLTIQFLLSIVLISGSIIVYLQFNFLRNRPLGFQQEQVLSIPVQSENMNIVFRPGDVKLRTRMNLFDDEITLHPHIKAVTQCSDLPGMGAVQRQIWTEKVSQEENLFCSILAVDYDFVETFELKMVAGRDFDLTFGTDHKSSFLINEKAVEILGWSDPFEALGNKINLEGKKGFIVGVVENFHYENLRENVQPLVMEVNPGVFTYFAVSIDSEKIPASIAFMKKKWRTFFPEKAFEYQFLDETLDQSYASERRLSRIIGIFAIIAIILSSIGLLGLAAIVTQRRIREISIRKVLGASLESILLLLSSQFLSIILLAVIISLPLTWWIMYRWLTDFPYRISFPWWIPLIVGIGIVLLAFLVVSSHTLKVARINPVKALRED